MCVYIYGYVCVVFCVCLLMGGQEGDLISVIFKAALEYSEDLSLSILVRRPRKELCPRKPARPEEGAKDVSQKQRHS